MGLSRRRLLAAGGLAAGGMAVGGVMDRARALVERAAATGTRCGSLSDIEHVVILVQENRSFDHYFGTYPGVAGFSDPHVLRQPHRGGRPVWFQYGWGPGDHAAVDDHYLRPFHLDTRRTSAECVSDITHAWGAQHASWHGGLMDGFVAAHIASDGMAAGPMTMGHYTRDDLGVYFDLADAFTLCDQYHCSVLGPSVPNQLHYVGATIDPHGHAGGPVVENPSITLSLFPPAGTPQFRWETMPELLEKAGVSWNFYQPPGSWNSVQVSNNPLVYFPRFRSVGSTLFDKAFLPTFPGQFQYDVLTGNLPQVSWITSMSGLDEHPPSPNLLGEVGIVSVILASLMANPAVWERTVVFVTYDENGGFFDHVPPPVSPPGTPGEWLTAPATVGDAGGVHGPVGLGFRVPLLVLSPYSVGGRICSDVADHTSLLRFIETRFGVRVPNLSAWRRSVTGDLTGALSFSGGAGKVSPSLVPRLALAGAGHAGQVATECPSTLSSLIFNPPAYPVPPNGPTVQERGTRPHVSAARGCAV